MSSGDNRSRLIIWYQAVIREALWHMCDRTNLFVTEYPKSGASWLSQLISQSLDIPFHRNMMPKFRNNLIHGHKAYHKNYDKKNVVLMVRDGRDVMVSAYYHLLFTSDKNNPGAVNSYRKQLKFKDYDNIQDNLPMFLEFMFTKKIALIDYGNWADFNMQWLESGVHAKKVSYEDLRRSPQKTLSNLFLDLDFEVVDEVIDRAVGLFDFEKQKKELKNNSFLRKGIVGDWKNQFNSESIDIFKHFGGQTLVELGYEKNLDWQ
jgi:hypothetical protein